MRLLIILLLIPVWLHSADTLYVARFKPPDRTVQAVILPGWSVSPTTSARKVTLSFRTLVRDSLAAKWDTLSFAPRLIGMDTTRLEIRYTTEDTLPADFAPGEWRLTAEGKFERK